MKLQNSRSKRSTPAIKLHLQVENRGPSDIESAEVYILWPSLRGQEQPLLYLTGQPIVEGPGSCHYVSDVNTHNIKVSGNISNINFLQPSSSLTKTTESQIVKLGICSCFSSQSPRNLYSSIKSDSTELARSKEQQPILET